MILVLRFKRIVAEIRLLWAGSQKGELEREWEGWCWDTNELRRGHNLHPYFIISKDVRGGGTKL